MIGLGYVELPLAVEFGKHKPVVGFDINMNVLKPCKPDMTRREIGGDELAKAVYLKFHLRRAT